MYRHTVGVREPQTIGKFANLSDAKAVADRQHNPGRRATHTAKFDQCVKSVKKRLKGVANPYAVCMAALGKKALRKR